MPNPPGGFFAHKQYLGAGLGQTGPDPPCNFDSNTK